MDCRLERLLPAALEEGIVERYSVFVSIVLNHVSEARTEFYYALKCLELLLSHLGITDSIGFWEGLLFIIWSTLHPQSFMSENHKFKFYERASQYWNLYSLGAIPLHFSSLSFSGFFCNLNETGSFRQNHSLTGSIGFLCVLHSGHDECALLLLRMLCTWPVLGDASDLHDLVDMKIVVQMSNYLLFKF